MVNMLKYFKYKKALILIVVYSNFSAYSLESYENRESRNIIGDKLFILSSNVIEYSVSGSSLFEFNINSTGEIENLHIIEPLGIPIDKSIIDALIHYVSIKVISKNDNIKNQCWLKVKLED